MTVVAIDGPAGAGKSTVARAVADRLGYTYLDSGAMYRSVGLAALRQGLEPADVAPLVKIELSDGRVRLDGQDVTDQIRTPEVSEAASRAAAEPGVRQAMVQEQRRLLEQGDWVVEGRDIGTVGAAELGADPATVLAEQTIRDQRDSTRAHSPLQPAPDAVRLDTTGVSLEDVVARVVELVHEAERGQRSKRRPR
jgi:cytidylate kinase